MIDIPDVDRHPDGEIGRWLVRLRGWEGVEVREGHSISDFTHKTRRSIEVLFPIDKDGNRVELKPKPLKVGDFVVHKPTLTHGVIAVAQPDSPHAKVLLVIPVSVQLIEVQVSDLELAKPTLPQKSEFRVLREIFNNATSAFASKY